MRTRDAGRLGRRPFLGGAAMALIAGCNAIRFESTTTPIRLAISPGTQTLWRYMVARKNDLRAKAHLVDFHNAQSEEQLQAGLLEGRYDAIATLMPAVARLAESTAVQFFLPIAWLHEGYPLIVPESSAIRSIADLAGKRVASFPLEHPGFAYWRAFLLKHHGMRAETVSTFQTLDPHQPLASGEVDAAFVAGSGWASLQIAGGYRKIADLQGEFKRLTGSDRPAVFAGFVGRSAWIAERGRLIGDLIAQANQALTHYRRDLDGFLETVTAEPSWASLTREENLAISRYLGYEAVDPGRVYLEPTDVEDYRRFFPLLADAGVTKAPPGDPGALFSLPKR